MRRSDLAEWAKIWAAMSTICAILASFADGIPRHAFHLFGCVFILLLAFVGALWLKAPAEERGKADI